MTTKRNIPSDSKEQTSTLGRTPIVITGTLPRDEHSLKLIARLNALRVAGKIDVYYFPEQDQEDELAVLVQPDKSRVTNPARVPEDLQVSEVISATTDAQYYKEVDKKLRAQGTPAIVLAFPEKSSSLDLDITFRFSGSWNDSGSRFSRGTQVTVPVRYRETPVFLDQDLTLSRISAANISHLISLRGPKIPISVDKKVTRAAVDRALLEKSGKTFNDDYLDLVMSHIISNAPNQTEGISTTGVVNRSGIDSETHNSTASFSEAAITMIDEILDRDPELAQAIQTAESILTKAREEAQKIIEDARISETETLERVEQIERETIARIQQLEHDTIQSAQERADDITDAAIEAGRIIPELTEMLKGGPFQLMAASAQREHERQQAQEQTDAQNRLEQALAKTRGKQLAVKTQLDIIVQSFQTIGQSRITSWGAGWETESYKRNVERIFSALRKATGSSDHQIPRFEETERMIDETNLGHKPMSIEDATLAIGLNAFVRETRMLEPYKRLSQWAKTDEWDRNGLDSWDIDQTQMDRAFMQALLAHCSPDGFSESDRKFLETCDHILEGEISQSLRRSLDGHLMATSHDEIAALDPFSRASGTDGLLDEIEELSRQQGLIANGSVSGTLRSTLEEVNRAAAHSAAQRSNGTANKPIAPAVGEPAHLVMRSDGSVVDFPQR